MAFNPFVAPRWPPTRRNVDDLGGALLALVAPRRRPVLRRTTLLLSLLTSVALAQTAVPTIKCKDATQGRANVVYVVGTASLRGFLGLVSTQVQADGFSIVYQAKSSCEVVGSVLDVSPSAHLMKDVPAANGKPANYAIVFLPDGAAKECFLDPAGNTVDVGVSDLYATTCGYGLGTATRDYEGPVLAMALVVSASSSQRSISAEAAYMAFGMGGNAGRAAPWTDPALFFVGDANSGTQQLIARAIQVPAEKWWGADRGSSSAVRTGLKLLAAADAEKGLGILSMDIADDERDNLRTLAFKPFGGQCGYLPDAKDTSFEKRNVRDGHYPIWGSVHFLTTTTGGGPSPAALALVARFAVPRLDQRLVSTIIASHLIPKCAMKVRRTAEMGPFSARGSDDFGCDCSFEAAATGVTPTGCTPCSSNAACPASAPTCNYGYCEVH